MKESKLTADPKAAKTTPSQTLKNKAQPTERHHTENRMLKEGKECLPAQAVPAVPKLWRTAVR
jgi:hypothetical protein